ncbi:hypothetical protein JYU34_019066 [Plutella xylostella]|uniref:Uncharacterized protein n=1 Tax=Plutella xylostella TaxID=51655 RepID=A0ABQ7PZD1_PLUXY|nr:hypothetical protein JYU34_019066 [Plutella xylostella]
MQLSLTFRAVVTISGRGARSAARADTPRLSEPGDSCGRTRVTISPPAYLAWSARST